MSGYCGYGGDMTNAQYNLVTFGATSQEARREQLVDMLKNCPLPQQELLLNLGLFLVPQTLSRILFIDFLYRKVLEVQGVVMDFGTRWGQNLCLFTSLRGIYEPFNRLRKIVAFDSFEGFPIVTAEDGEGRMMSPGSYAVSKGYEEYLERLVTLCESESPLDHVKKHEIVKGDASIEVPAYMRHNPETIVALAYFDFDLYKPTRDCLLAIRDRLTRGSVIAFDELNDHECPGETLAVMEILGLGNVALKRFCHNSRTSYLVVDTPMTCAPRTGRWSQGEST